VTDVGTLALLDSIFSQSETRRGGQQLQTHLAPFSRPAIDIHGGKEQLILTADTVRVAAPESGGEA
jgi:hypothetical protein